MAQRQLLGQANVDLCGTICSITWLVFTRKLDVILGTARAKALAKEIASEKKTTVLVMAENECGNEGLVEVVSALEKNSSIESLSLISACDPSAFFLTCPLQSRKSMMRLQRLSRIRW
jgi:hypothetical protein